MSDVRQGKKSLNHHTSALARGGGITVGGNLLGRFLRFLSSLVLVRLLDVTSFGLFTLGFMIVQLAGYLAMLGMDKGLLRYIPMHIRRGDPDAARGVTADALTIGTVLSLVIAVGIFLVRDLFAVAFDKPGLGEQLAVLAWAVPGFTIVGLLIHVLNGYKAIGGRVLVEQGARYGARVVLLAGCLVLGAGKEWVWWVIVVSNLLPILLAIYLLRTLFPDWWRGPRRHHRREMVSFSLPLVITGFLSHTLEQMDVLMLGRLGSEQDLAVYSVALKYSPLVLVPLGAFVSTFSPMVAELYTAGEHEALARSFKLVTRWTFSASLPIFLCLALLADPLVGLFGEAYTSAATPLVILAAAQLINASVGLSGRMLMMTGRPQWVLWNTIAGLLLNFVFNLYCIPRWGIVGAAWATGASVAVVNLARLLQIFFFMHMHPYTSSFLKPIVAAVVTLGTIVVARHWLPILDAPTGLPIALTVFGVCYAGALVTLGLDEEDREIVARVRARLTRTPRRVES